MTSVFINKAGNKELILFFNGWGKDQSRFVDWPCGAVDVLELHDFAQEGALPDLSGYPRIHLIAWSLGVWAAGHLLAKHSLPLVTRLALNGTLKPIDAHDGIPPEIFDGTIENWEDARAREKFGLRVSGTTASFSLRTPENQKAELIALRRMITTSPPPLNLFTTALISTRDRIFPPAAQRHFWSQCDGVTLIEKPFLHDPFVSLNTWEEVLDLAKT